MKHTFKIKNFGNDRVCQSIDELVRSLSTEYKGKDVSVFLVNKDDGMNKKITFVSVSKGGLISLSYVDDSEFETENKAVEHFAQWFDLK